MKLIDRYVDAVTARLPENMREDIMRELNANIEDMLPENPSEEDVRRVLEKLGSPVKLANEYSPKKRYLIGPELYDSYISVLRLVITILAAVVVFSSLISEIFNPRVEEGLVSLSVGIFVKIIVSAVEGVMQGFVWVTVVFAILERTGVNEGQMPFAKKKWTVDDLDKEPVSKKRKISRGETIFSMVWVVLFTSILYFSPQLIGIYGKRGDGIVLTAPLFENGRLGSYMFMIILIAVLQFSILAWKFIAMKWSIPLAVGNTFINIVVCILLFVMVSDSSLINQNFVTSFADLTKIPLSEVSSGWSWGLKMFGVVFVVISTWDSISGFLKCRK